MAIENLKIAIKNMSSYLEECHDESDTITLTANVLKSIKENYEELINFKNKADFVEVPCKCRNCKHRRETMHGSYCLPAFGLKQITDLDAFCSYGEPVNYGSSKTERE